jgi:quercetin dioxygenase-like cupin family protein
MDAVKVTRWQGAPSPSVQQIEQTIAQEGHTFFAWSNAPGDRYSAHTHAYDKLLYCLRGSITFDLPQSNESIELRAGDRLELPKGTLHSAVVGSNGVLCCEAHF